jgi:MFS family permease
MAFQQSDTLANRSFVGLIIAQFLAGFNDQAIHASSMFFAIHKHSLTEAQAISLMPILFYAPWAIFCTLAGYLADRFSKRHALVTWKIAEVGIMLVALVGFWMNNAAGSYVVLSTVFLMGTHAAFFAPAKYGAMPEILKAEVLSRGNGILESTTFLAAILGTVSGGLLSSVFKDQPYLIGLILMGLSLVGVAASFLIARMPAANPGRPFPTNLLRPLLDNLRTLLRSKPLALSVLGIAFFIFMVSYMRATMYMHGESRNPHWDEFRTSLVVATVALGVGLGSPLAGFLSGGKVELGLVPLGAVGMAVAAVMAALLINWVPGLVASLIVIGFFSGFYMVPLYTLLQHRAPKTSKGDLIATSNFINVTGAIAASVLFFVLVFAARKTGLAPRVEQREFAEGTLVALKHDKKGRPDYFRVQTGKDANGRPEYVEVDARGKHRPHNPEEDFLDLITDEEESPDTKVIEVANAGLIEAVGTSLAPGDRVKVSTYTIPREGQDVVYYMLAPYGQEMTAAYNYERLPRYLFLGAALMTVGILVLLCRQLPDFFVRALLWLRSRSRYRLKVIGMHNLPTEGPVILATNCDRFEASMQVVAATDRFTRFVLLEDPADRGPTPLLRYLARRTGMIVLHPESASAQDWEKARSRAARTLHQGCLLAITVPGGAVEAPVAKLLTDLAAAPAPIVPVYCGSPAGGPVEGNGPVAWPRPVRVVIGLPAQPGITVAELRQRIRVLGDWVHTTEAAGEVPATVRIPGASSALPKPTAGSPPPHP